MRVLLFLLTLAAAASASAETLTGKIDDPSLRRKATLVPFEGLCSADIYAFASISRDLVHAAYFGVGAFATIHLAAFEPCVPLIPSSMV